MRSLSPRLLRLGLLALALTLVGCTVPVAGGLDESDANRIVVSLDRASVEATKEPDPQADGRFRIMVAQGDAARALSTMQTEGLPRPKPAGVLDAIDKGALVPSRAAEHAQWMAGLSGDLERTLEGVDGVLSARVHLNVPEPDALSELRDARDIPNAKATASVLIERRGAGVPIAVPEVQRLVAGGVPSLAPADVAVLMLERSGHGSAADGEAPALAHVGPIAVARGSMRTLQVTLVGLVALVAVLAGALLVLYTRLAGLRAAAEEAGQVNEAAARARRASKPA